MQKLVAISPILLLLLGAIAALVIGIFLPRRRQTWIAVLAVLCLSAAAAAAALKLGHPPGLVFEASYVVDGPMLWTLLALLAAGFLTIALAAPVFKHDAREAEFYVLLLFSLLGAVMLAGANDVMEILLGVLLTSIGSYALVGYRRTHPPAMEALLKYYLFGALTNIALIYGLILLYGLSGHTLLGDIAPALVPGNRVVLSVAMSLILLGLGFKAGYVPAHFWIPDVYEGATVPVAAYLSIVPKIAGVAILARLVAAFPPATVNWPLPVAIISAVTMTWGNIAAFRQNDIRRLLGYSSIAQTGFLLFGVVAVHGAALALPGLMYYFAAYLLANFGAFAVLAASRRYTIAANGGLVHAHPALAFAMLISMLSLVGIPPLAGFVAKFTLFSAAVEAGFTWLTILGVTNSLLSLYYYLRVIAPMFFAPERETIDELPPFSSATATACASLSLLLGLAAFLLLDSPLPLKFLS
jgi:NADH-quinone oxidoreductase subunit N